jgi:hypothetical protein
MFSFFIFLDDIWVTKPFLITRNKLGRVHRRGLLVTQLTAELFSLSLSLSFFLFLSTNKVN